MTETFSTWQHKEFKMPKWKIINLAIITLSYLDINFEIPMTLSSFSWLFFYFMEKIKFL
jgi:hypothetical protein